MGYRMLDAAYSREGGRDHLLITPFLMPWQDLTKESEEYQEHFARLCVKHETLYWDRCPAGNHEVKTWEVVNLKTGVSIFVVKDNEGPVKVVKKIRAWVIGKFSKDP